MACYEALSGGRYPFEGHSVRAIARMVAQGTRPARPDGVPEAVWEAVAGCWEGDPGRRWTVGEVIERFEAVLRGM
ncbi:hypothetical protein DFJ74DRAFT_687567 [Hyaloraphidium curvatum]|nr:hypothetical protein DFJ74DRAFT_687567 [Hyaloraphidium curvatum]